MEQEIPKELKIDKKYIDIVQIRLSRDNIKTINEWFESAAGESLIANWDKDKKLIDYLNSLFK